MSQEILVNTKDFLSALTGAEKVSSKKTTVTDAVYIRTHGNEVQIFALNGYIAIQYLFGAGEIANTDWRAITKKDAKDIALGLKMAESKTLGINLSDLEIKITPGEDESSNWLARAKFVSLADSPTSLLEHCKINRYTTPVAGVFLPAKHFLTALTLLAKETSPVWFWPGQTDNGPGLIETEDRKIQVFIMPADRNM
jgi:hypothetical protein